MSAVDNGYWALRSSESTEDFKIKQQIAKAARENSVVLPCIPCKDFSPAVASKLNESFTVLQDSVNDLIWAVSALEADLIMQRDKYKFKIDRIEEVQNELLWRITEMEAKNG